MVILMVLQCYCWSVNFSALFLANPSAPYDIALLNCDGHSMVLNWKKPLHSGGANIKEYYVDKRRSGTTMWREIHIPPLTERVYKVMSVFNILICFLYPIIPTHRSQSKGEHR